MTDRSVISVISLQWSCSKMVMALFYRTFKKQLSYRKYMDLMYALHFMQL